MKEDRSKLHAGLARALEELSKFQREVDTITAVLSEERTRHLEEASDLRAQTSIQVRGATGAPGPRVERVLRLGSLPDSTLSLPPAACGRT